MDLYARHISEAVLQTRFGLTTAEAQIVLALASGANVRGIATARGASILTVRSQLKSIFRKTGVTSQARLVALVLR